MTNDLLYERVRAKFNEGYGQNPFAPLLKDREAVLRPMEGKPEQFSQIAYELTRGKLNEISDDVAYVTSGTRDLLKFRDGRLFSVVRRLGTVVETLIIVAPHEPAKDELLRSREMPLAHLVFDRLRIRDAFKRVAFEYEQEERKFAAEQASQEIRQARESRVDMALKTIERAKSGETIMIRGLANIDELVRLGFVPCLVDNPDNWVDAEDFPGLRYRAKSGTELLLTGREKLRPIEDVNRLALYFFVNRSDDDPAAFAGMLAKFRETKTDGTPYAASEFHDDLIALAKFPEGLKDRTEEDLEVMADEVENVMDRRKELDKGILPYEALGKKDTKAILDYIAKNRTPVTEARKALDFCVYTGVIDAEYKGELVRQITSETAAVPAAATSPGALLYDKRVKEIVATVLKKIPREHLTAKTITLAIAPYVSELGFGKLVKIRERILQLKELVHDQAS